MNTLITVSIGLYFVQQHNQYYLQIIDDIADCRYINKCTRQTAERIKKESNLHIQEITFDNIVKLMNDGK